MSALAWNSAAVAHPDANARTLAVIRPSRARATRLFSFGMYCAISAVSIMIWVVVPVITVVGGELPR